MGLFTVSRVCRRLAAAAMGLAIVLAVSGCATTPQPELPVPIEISIAASESLNPTAQGRASPVLLRIYELSGQTFFQSADFFTLLGEVAQTNHAEVLEMHEFMLMPGEIRVLRRRTKLPTRFLGVAVAYRDLQGSAWRALATVPAPRTASRWWPADTSPQQRYRVVAGENSVVIETVER